MTKKVIIVGGVAGGASTAARLRRVDEGAEIILLEKGEHISFANCGLPYHIGEVITERSKLLVQTPEKMKQRFNIDVRVFNEAISIDREKKLVQIKDHQSGEVYEENYDFLVLSPGANPVRPAIPGINHSNIFNLRNIPDTDRIKGFVDEQKPKSAVVVGGGFIGLEMVENLHHRNLNVTLVEMADQVMAPLDFEMAAMVHQHIRSKNVNLILQDGVKEFTDHSGQIKVSLQSGKEIITDLVIMAIGVKPDIALAKSANLEIGDRGGIKVDEYLKTSDPAIFAIGDAIEVEDFVTGQNALIPLAGPANKQGRIVANNIANRPEKYKKTQGTAIAKVFDLTVASTGSNEKNLKKENIDYISSITHSSSHAGYYPGAIPMAIKINFTPTGKLLGAQVVGYDGVDKRLDVLATSLRFEKTVFDLQELELAYAPPFSSAKDPVNMAGYAAGNIINNDTDIIHWHELVELDSEKSVLVDVRTKMEWDMGSIEGAINLPLDELRDHLSELPQDKEIIIFCKVGLRGYLATRILKQHGFEKVRNLSGGYCTYQAVHQELHLTDADLTPPTNCGNCDGEVVNKIEEQTNTNVNTIDISKENVVKLDACGLQCPGPIMQVFQKMNEMNPGEILEVRATDPGFVTDIPAWCRRTGNSLVKQETGNNCFIAYVQKGGDNMQEVSNQSISLPQNKTMVVFSGDLDKAIASFIIANGAASMGREVTMFFTFWGLNILRKPKSVKVKKGLLDKMFGMMMPRGSKKLGLSNMNMLGIGPKMIRYVMENKGVDSLEALIGQAKMLGINLVACQMSMDVMGIKKEELIEGVQIGGVASYLGAAEEANVNLFI